MPRSFAVQSLTSKRHWYDLSHRELAAFLRPLGFDGVRYALSKIKGRTADSPSQGAPARLGNKIEDQIVEAFHHFSYASVSLVRFEKQG